MKLIKIGLIILFQTFFILYGQNNNFIQLFDQYENGGEIYFRLKNENLNLEFLTNIISIDHKTNGEWVYGYANEEDYKEFSLLNLNLEPLQHPGTLISPKMKNKIYQKQANDWDYYPTYEAYVDLMYQFQANYPDLCTVVNIGQTVEGRDLLFARISDNAGWDEGEAQFMYTSSMHGDEVAGYILFLRLIDYLLTNYGTNDQVTYLVNNLDIWINPLANPDGTYNGGNNTLNGATRFNANNVDLNRNYPDPEDGPHPDGKAWQPETMAFMQLAEQNHFLMSANCHGGAEVFNYPWDTWPQLHADDDWWYYVGREWADTVHAYGPPGYFNDLNNGVTNGYQWYTTNGCRQDYMTFFHRGREFTLEISSIKVLPESLLPQYWEYNYRSFLNYMKQALFGMQGTITDSITGLPLGASVYIENHDTEDSWLGSNPIDGWFFRPVFEGAYDLTVFSPGYDAKNFTNVEVINQQSTLLNIELVPSESTIEENSISENFSIGPNPAKDKLIISYSGNSDSDFNLTIQDVMGKILYLEKLSYHSNDYIQTVDLKSIKKDLIFVEISNSHEIFTWKIVHVN